MKGTQVPHVRNYRCRGELFTIASEEVVLFFYFFFIFSCVKPILETWTDQTIIVIYHIVKDYFSNVIKLSIQCITLFLYFIMLL